MYITALTPQPVPAVSIIARGWATVKLLSMICSCLPSRIHCSRSYSITVILCKVVLRLSISARRMSATKARICSWLWRGLELPQRLYCGHLAVSVAPWVPSPRQCQTCWCFRHVKRNCRSRHTCGMCAEHHPTEGCDAPLAASRAARPTRRGTVAAVFGRLSRKTSPGYIETG